jgi:hypothetical protein
MEAEAVAPMSTKSLQEAGRAVGFFGKVLRIHPHDARVMNHLRQNHDRIRGLHDLMEIVVEIVRQRRRARCGTESEQATLAERPLLGIIESAGRRGSAALALWGCGLRRRPGGRDSPTCGLVVGRQPAVWRIDDDRCSNLPTDLSVG